MVDGRGAVPLSFVQKDYWGQWIEFLKAKQSHFWPKRNATCNKQAPPPLTLHEPNSRPLPNPIGALSPKQASMLVSGKLTPENVRSASRTYCASSDDDDDDSFASEENDHDDSSCSTDTFDMNEMEDLLRQISQPVVRSRIETWRELLSILLLVMFIFELHAKLNQFFIHTSGIEVRKLAMKTAC